MEIVGFLTDIVCKRKDNGKIVFLYGKVVLTPRIYCNPDLTEPDTLVL